MGLAYSSEGWKPGSHAQALDVHCSAATCEGHPFFSHFFSVNGNFAQNSYFGLRF